VHASGRSSESLLASLASGELTQKNKKGKKMSLCEGAAAQDVEQRNPRRIVSVFFFFFSCSFNRCFCWWSEDQTISDSFIDAGRELHRSLRL
jgi:hypothetical protein